MIINDTFNACGFFNQSTFGSYFRLGWVSEVEPLEFAVSLILLSTD